VQAAQEVGVSAADQKTPAAVAAAKIVDELGARARSVHPRSPGELLAAWTAIIAQATLDACEQAAPRVRAEERERIALAFEAESEAPEMRAHAKCLRASAAFVRALGEKP
jgi:hypothetical protein